jgi:integrase
MPSRVTLRRRPDRPYWYLEWTDDDGNSHRKSTRKRDRGAAEVLRAALELDHARGEAGIPVAAAVSLADALGEYLAETEVLWYDRWWSTVDGFARLQVVPAFDSDRVVSSVLSPEVARFRVAQLARPNLRFRPRCCPKAGWTLGTVGAWVCNRCSAPFQEDGKRVSPATVNRLFWAMASFGGWCVKRRYHLENPWSIESLAEDDLPPPTVTEEELARIFAGLENRPQATFPWRALFEFARETGLRRSELARLARRDINETERRADVVSSHARGLTKSGKRRTVALTRRALEILAALPERKDGLVFGRIPDPRRAFAAATKAAGLERVWLHLMRHVGATETGRAGASLADLMGFGGWASIRMAQRYTHTDHRRQVEIADRRDANRIPPASRPAPEKPTGGSE